MNMNIPTPKIGALHMGPKTKNGDSLKNGPNHFTFQLPMETISLNKTKQLEYSGT
jgi:hypothetical protein